jgi:hypothetical protein
VLNTACYDDGAETHVFRNIRLDGRMSVRTPRRKLALLRFRYVTRQTDSGAEQVGWWDAETGQSCVRVYYPKAHAQGAKYPKVHLAGEAAVHEITLAAAGPEREGGEEEIDEGERGLLGFFAAHGSEAAGKLVPAKMGMYSFRTNSCRWLEALVHQDATWRAKDESKVDEQTAAPTLEIKNPDRDDKVKFALADAIDGELLYAESLGLFSGAHVLFKVGDVVEDRWELMSDAGADTVRLRPMALADLHPNVNVTPRELLAQGFAPKAREIEKVPVEMVVLSFTKLKMLSILQGLADAARHG